MPAQRPVIQLIDARAAPEGLKGRGTAWSIAHRFSARVHEDFDDGWGTQEQAVREERLAPQTQVIEEQVRSILTANDSPDIGFDLSINPYRGCEHGCIYCYARPTHSYLNLSPGLDFETTIVAKVNAAERLREAFARRGYEPKMLNLGSVTDAYQPAERRLRITRSVIEVLAECRHAFSVITKSSLVERDLDLIAPMAAARLAAVYVSITTLDPKLARMMEPRAASPQRRLRTHRDAGARRRAGGRERVADDPVPQRARARAHSRGRGGGGRQPRLQHRAAPALGSEPAVPAMAGAAFPRARGAHHGAGARDARRPRQRRPLRLAHDGQGVWAQLLRQRFDKASARLGLNRERIELDLTPVQAAARRRPGALAARPACSRDSAAARLRMAT